jgi:spore germination protein KA
MPYLLIENFQSSDDYYVNYYYSSINRLIRIISFFISTSTPAIYLSLTTIHHEMLPANLIESISIARQGVPLPTVLKLL